MSPDAAGRIKKWRQRHAPPPPIGSLIGLVQGVQALDDGVGHLEAFLREALIALFHTDLAQGDVVIETPNGNVDARLSTQLDMIRKSIQDAMK